jgi:hypothetical protein
LVAAFVGCDDDPTTPGGLAVCRTPVTITVSAGLTPTFNWTPACRVEALTVRHAANGATMWSLFATLDNRGIPPGVRYATVPVGAFELGADAPPPLEAGATYVVTLTVFGFPTGPEQEFRQEFTP